MTSRSDEAESIALELLDVQTFHREAWLSERCAGDRELAQSVSALVSGYHRAEAFLAEARPWVELAKAARTKVPIHSLVVNATIGDWKITEQIFGGGMSEVYAVTRIQGGFDQEGVLKILPGATWDRETHRQRFRRERQILAGLRHAAIAPLLDGGSLDGRPYIVTERAGHLGIVDYCNANAATMEERLTLLLEALDAIGYAHDQGIAHCDIKPNNVLVGDDGHVRVVDFGIARLTTSAEVSGPGSLHLTPGYASPEQVAGQVGTTLSDVYSFGVLLVELMTGFQPEPLSVIGAGPATRRPTGQLMTKATLQPAIGRELANLRRLSLREFEQILAGPLNEIAARALHEDAAHRFASVGELAAAVNAYRDQRTAERIFKTRNEFPVETKGRVRFQALYVFAAGLAAGAIVTYFFVG